MNNWQFRRQLYGKVASPEIGLLWVVHTKTGCPLICLPSRSVQFPSAVARPSPAPVRPMLRLCAAYERILPFKRPVLQWQR